MRISRCFKLIEMYFLVNFAAEARRFVYETIICAGIGWSSKWYQTSMVCWGEPGHYWMCLWKRVHYTKEITTEPTNGRKSFCWKRYYKSGQRYVKDKDEMYILNWKLGQRRGLQVLWQLGFIRCAFREVSPTPYCQHILLDTSWKHVYSRQAYAAVHI